MMKTLSICITLALALPLTACKDHAAEAAHEALHAQQVQANGVGAGAANSAAANSATASAVGDDPTVPRLAVGTKAKCAVSGEDFTVRADTVQVTYAGQRYAFCCADCQPTFAKNPAKYAKR
jgi:YHS domain-containing protein